LVEFHVTLNRASPRSVLRRIGTPRPAAFAAAEGHESGCKKRTSPHVSREVLIKPVPKHKKRKARYALPLHGVIGNEMYQVSRDDRFAALKSNCRF